MPETLGGDEKLAVCVTDCDEATVLEAVCESVPTHSERNTKKNKTGIRVVENVTKTILL